MELIALQSGSNGNCVYVEARGVRLLFDAGISGVQAAERLAAHGRSIGQVDALIISHDHRDHVRSAGIFQRKFGLPVYITSRTLAAARRRCKLGALEEVLLFRAGAALRFGPVTVHTIPTPHDGADGVAFVVDDGTRRLGILTDLGHVFSDLCSVIGSVDAALLESNYDPDLLDDGWYPDWLKQRIRGPAGHLSNPEAAKLIADHATPRLRWVCLGHLSEDNNSPELALQAHRRALGRQVSLYVASRYEASSILVV